MAADFNKPTVSDVYTAVPGMIRDNDAAVATMHETDASSNKPVGTKQITATGTINRWSGSAWVTLGTSVPSGMLSPYVGAAAPSGWLLADGSAVSQTTYAALFAAIGGHVFGADPGSGNFLLPNLKGKVVVGFNSTETEFDAIGETGGVKTHALSEAELATHTHAISVSASTGAESSNHGHDQTGIAGYTGSAGLAGGSDYSSLTQETGAQKTGHTHSVSATGSATSVGSGTAHNNLQPYITLKYIIKT